MPDDIIKKAPVPEAKETNQPSEPEREALEKSEEIQEGSDESLGAGEEEVPTQDGAEKVEESASAPAPKTLKLKIGDNDEDVPEEEVIKAFLGRKEAQKIHKEAQDLREKAAWVLKSISEKPFESMMDILTATYGSKKAKEELLKVADQLLSSEFEYQKLPEPERKLLDSQKEIETYKQRLAELEAREQESRRAVEEARLVDGYLKEISSAIKETPGLEDDPDTYDQMAKVMIRLRSEGYEISAKDVAPMVKEAIEAKERQWEDRNTSNPEKFLKRYPKLIEAIRKADLKTVKGNIREMRAPNKADSEKRDVPPRKQIMNSAQIAELLGR